MKSIPETPVNVSPGGKTGSRPKCAHRALTLGTAALLLAGAIFLGSDSARFPVWVWVAMCTGVIGGAAVIWTARTWIQLHMSARWLLAAGIGAVVFRMALWPADRYLSDDAFRYHWDGKVLCSGINPYRHAPADPEVAHLRVHAPDERINHPQVRTVYPPLAQAYFALGYLLSPGSLNGFKVLVLLGEIMMWLLLFVELDRRRLPRSQLLLAIWSPLVFLESHLPGHLDALALPWIALFVVGLSRGWTIRAGLALAAACLIKPLPIIFIPAAFCELGLKRSLKFSLVFAVATAAGYLPFIGAGQHLFESMWLMARLWSFNSSLAAILESSMPRETARLVAAGVLAALLLVSVRVGRDLISRLLMAFAAFVICTPNFFPWYAMIMFPLLTLRPDPALLALSVALPLTEVVVIDYRLHGLWRPPLWPVLAEYIPFYLILILGVWRGWGMFRREDRPATTV